MLRRVLRASVLAGAALAGAVGASPPARAHPMDVAHADVSIGAREVGMRLTVRLFELDLLLGLDRDGDGAIGEDELSAARPRVLEYLRSRISVTSAGAPLPLEAGTLRSSRGADGRALLEVGLRFAAAEALQDVAIRCEPLVDVGAGHRTLGRIAHGRAVEQFVFSNGAVYRAGRSSAAVHLAQLLRLGVFHIFTGYDHVLFLIGLILASAGLREVLKVVTSFTLAHSITLTLAAVGLVTLPPRLVEAGIAASIAYVALENLLRRRLERPWLVSLGFGLVHGFGFANALAELRLPRGSLAGSLASFNVGVELGQVAIVLAALPLLAWLRRSPAYRPLMASASAAMLAVGVFWLYQRAL